MSYCIIRKPDVISVTHTQYTSRYFVVFWLRVASMGQVTHIVGCIVGVWEYKGRPLEPINDSCLDALLKAAASDSWRLWCCTCGFQFDPKFMFGAKNSLECLLCQTKPLTVTQKETHKLQAGNYNILLLLCMCTCMRLSA